MQRAERRAAMLTIRFPHVALLAALIGAAGSALVSCAGSSPEPELSFEQRVGVDNVFGLGLRYDRTRRKIVATLNEQLPDGERLYVRVRRGKLTLTSQKELDCA